MARRKSGEPKVVKFMPCHASHYRNMALNTIKKVSDIREGIAVYNGLDDEMLVSALDKAQLAAQELAFILNSKSSKPVEFGSQAEDTDANWQ